MSAKHCLGIDYLAVAVCRGGAATVAQGAPKVIENNQSGLQTSEMTVRLSHAALCAVIESRRSREWLTEQFQDYARLYGACSVQQCEQDLDYQLIEIARRALGLNVDVERSDGCESYIVDGFVDDDEAVLFKMSFEGRR